MPSNKFHEWFEEYNADMRSDCAMLGKTLVVARIPVWKPVMGGGVCRSCYMSYHASPVFGCFGSGRAMRQWMASMSDRSRFR